MICLLYSITPFRQRIIDAAEQHDSDFLFQIVKIFYQLKYSYESATIEDLIIPMASFINDIPQDNKGGCVDKLLINLTECLKRFDIHMMSIYDENTKDGKKLSTTITPPIHYYRLGLYETLKVTDAVNRVFASLRTKVKRTEPPEVVIVEWPELEHTIYNSEMSDATDCLNEQQVRLEVEQTLFIKNLQPYFASNYIGREYKLGIVVIGEDDIQDEEAGHCYVFVKSQDEYENWKEYDDENVCLRSNTYVSVLKQ